MHAIKGARAYTGRPKIAKCEGVYHGAYDYAEASLDPDPQNWGTDRPRAVGYAKGTPAGLLQDAVIIPFQRRGRRPARSLSAMPARSLRC